MDVKQHFNQLHGSFIILFAVIHLVTCAAFPLPPLLQTPLPAITMRNNAAAAWLAGRHCGQHRQSYHRSQSHHRRSQRSDSFPWRAWFVKKGAAHGRRAPVTRCGQHVAWWRPVKGSEGQADPANECEAAPLSSVSGTRAGWTRLASAWWVCCVVFRSVRESGLRSLCEMGSGQGGKRKALCAAANWFLLKCCLKPVLNIGRMFLREPSWKYSAKLIGS